MLQILESVFAGIHLRTALIKGEANNSIYLNFKQEFTYSEYENINKILLNFIKKLFNFLISNDIENDYQIMSMIVKIISQLMG